MSLLENKVIIVTASTRGIGRAIVAHCAHEGAIVYMAARNEQRAMAAVKELTDIQGRVKFVYNDATQPQTYETMAQDVFSAEGRIDGLVNNFGTSNVSLDRDIEHTKVDDFLSIVEVNIRSVFLGIQAVIPFMKKGKGGSIVCISSVAGTVPDISQIAYGTSKAAINQMARLIAVQEASHNIRCNIVSPGMTATDAVQSALTEHFRDIFLKNTPLHRMAQPDEIASAVAYFLSDGAAFTTGQNLVVSGGFGLATPIFGDLHQTNER